MSMILIVMPLYTMVMSMMMIMMIKMVSLIMFMIASPKMFLMIVIMSERIGMMMKKGMVGPKKCRLLSQ